MMSFQRTRKATFFTMFMLGVFLIIGCNNQPKETSKPLDSKLEEMSSRIQAEEGFIDVFLKIVQEDKTDSSRIYIAKGLYKNKPVGLRLEVKSTIPAGINSSDVLPKDGFVIDGVTIQSIGSESDAFLQGLAELYGQKEEQLIMQDSQKVTVFSLNEVAVDLDKPNLYKLKVFLEDPKEELYAEIFLNINTEKKEIELHEKDQEYRLPVIRSLSK